MLPLRIFTFSFPRAIFVAAIISITALVLASLFVYQVQTWPSARIHATSAVRSVSSGTVYLSAAGEAEAAAVTKEAPMREVHIANTGLMLLRGATVIATSRGTMRVSMAWDSADFTWTITTDSDTKFLTSKGQKATPEDIQAGDVVMITGQLTKSGTEPTIDAQYVRKN